MTKWIGEDESKYNYVCIRQFASHDALGRSGCRQNLCVGKFLIEHAVQPSQKEPAELSSTAFERKQKAVVQFLESMS